jgi:hypothetical protein
MSSLLWFKEKSVNTHVIPSAARNLALRQGESKEAGRDSSLRSE